MSISQRILKEDKTHKNSVRLVLLALAGSIDSGNACPSVAELADMAQITPTSARNALAQLEADKTITVNRQAGKSEKGGRTNCYSLPAYQDAPSDCDTQETDTSGNHSIEKHPPEIDQAGAKQGGEIHQAIEIPEGGNLIGSLEPLPFDGGEISSTVEYVGARAAGAGKDKELLKELEKEIKESVVISQTNSLKPENTSAPAQNSDIAPTTYAESLAATTPEVRANADALIAKAQPPADDVSSDPPGSALPPLPQSVTDAYVRKFAYDLTDFETKALQRLIARCGVEFVLDKIATARLVDGSHKRIENPARYIETTLDDESAKAKPQRLNKPAWAKALTEAPAEFFPAMAATVPDDKPFAPVAPVDPDWQRLCDFMRDTYSVLYKDHVKNARFGGVANGVITVNVSGMSAYRGCTVSLNHRGQFLKWCQDFWSGLTEVVFAIERTVPDAHPTTS